ncbi:hypothetical protein [Thiohalocapsa sp. ML1]|uniref:hypothetical protein n=1 Tax=Thiohalocapsa sp. ML1 TaxID=1431688 RepID=UPI000731F239|nr:hypothetical protein [Thiohalocapsa sp. ML1]
MNGEHADTERPTIALGAPAAPNTSGQYPQPASMDSMADAAPTLLGGLRRFFGLDIPPRAIELRFDTPRPNRKGRRPPLTPERAHALLGQNSATPDDYLKALLGIVGDLNRWPLDAERRLALLESLSGCFYAAVAPALKDLVAEGGGIPESPGRREVLELYERCAASLVQGYRALFAADYARSNFFYSRVRGRVYRCACRMLELIKLRQRLAGVRYLRLEADAWRTANTVFAALRACEPVDRVLDTLSLRNQSLDRRTQASLRQHYVSLSTYGILDATAWPEREQIAIDVYVNSVPHAIRVLDYDPRLDPRPWYLYASCYDDGAPTRRPPDDTRHGATVLLDHHALAAHIRADALALEQAIIAHDRFRVPPRLARIEADRRTAVAYLLQRNLRVGNDWTDEPAAAEQHRDLRVYAGFPEVRTHLLAIYSRDDDGRVKRSRELADLFAQRSAVIGEDDTAPQQSLWFVLQDSQDAMRIRTQETRFTNRMFVGNLLAYGFGEDEVRTPRIGKVNRIFRPTSGVVMLDIDYLASFATPVRLSGCAAPHPAGDSDPTLAPISEADLMGEPMTALLIHHPQHGWGIITPPQEQLWKDAFVCIRTGRRLTRARLGEVRDVTGEFCRFQVVSAALPAAAPSYPRPSAPAPAERPPPLPLPAG